MQQYTAHGQSILSEWALPDGVLRSSGDGPFDISVERGALDSHDPGETDGTYRFDEEAHEFYWPELGAIRIEASGRVIVDEKPSAPEGLVQHVLLGPVLADWLLWQGQMPLHASSVVVGDATIAIVGASGAGKSTLAAALIERGALAFADDLLGVVPETGVSEFGSARLKVNRDVLEHLSVPADGLPRAYASVEKRSIARGTPQVAPPARRLSAVYRLVDTADDNISATRLVGMQAALVFMGEVFRVEVAQHAFGSQILLDRGAKLAGQVPMFALHRPRNLKRLSELCAFVETHAVGLSSSP